MKSSKSVLAGFNSGRCRIAPGPEAIALEIAILFAVLAIPVLLASPPPAFGAAFDRTDIGAPQENIATFSVVAYDPSTGEVGVAVQSRFFAVGSVVPWCRAGVGAVASQAYGNPTYGPTALDMFEHGVVPVEALRKLLAKDKDAEKRQIGMVALIKGKKTGELIPMSYTYTGKECMSWAGGQTGKTGDGIVFAVQGNILTGPEVADAMAAGISFPADASGETFETTLLGGFKLTDEEKAAVGTGDLAGRMLRALIAGEAAGGDSRGMQSAALKVSQAGAGYGGYNDVKYDLRVDDAKDPFNEMSHLLNLARPIALTYDAYNRLYAKDFKTAISLFTKLIALEPDNAYHHYDLACAYSLSGRPDDAMAELSTALSLDEKLKDAAKTDKDLDALRGRDDFRWLVG